MNSIPKVAGLVARITLGLVVLACALLLIAKGESESTPLGAQAQGHGRVVMRRPWPVEPVKVVSAKTKKKEKVDIGKEFDEDDDWLEGFTVTIINRSEQSLTAVTIDMVFPREPGDSRPPLAETLHFGPRPTFPEYAYRDPNKVIKSGQTGELKLTRENYESMMRALEKLGYSKPVNRVYLVIKDVGFEDGSVLRSGTWYKQDPKSPHDPTKKIRV